MNSHELHSKIERWSIHKTPWAEKVFHLCDSMIIKDEVHSLLEFLSYTHISSKSHIIFYNTNLYNLLTCQNYSDLGKLLASFFNNLLKVSYTEVGFHI